METFIQKAQDQFEFSQSIRRDLHRHPELGFQEVRTAGIVAQELNRLGMEVTTGVAKTGVVAMLEGGEPGPVVLARFDMDALPVQEETGAEYASLVPGVMHACGHDGHVSIGLTVARLLAEQRQTLAGAVKFVFQPAEEGLGGALGMIREGVLQDPKPDYSLALHLWNQLPLGWVAITPGPFMAGADTFSVKITGKGGHGGLPHTTIDPILAAAQWITALQSIVSRNVSPLQSAVVSVTQVKGGDTFNVIPPSVELQGTIRSFEPAVRQEILERFETLLQNSAVAMGCQAGWELRNITPPVVNDPAVAGRLQSLAGRILPEFQLDPTFRTMVSEDMAYLMGEIPGCYFMLGSANAERGLNANHHHPRFDFDEAVLPKAAAFMAAAIQELLSS